jgi:hypothetical protein
LEGFGPDTDSLLERNRRRGSHQQWEDASENQVARIYLYIRTLYVVWCSGVWVKIMAPGTRHFGICWSF